MAQLEYKDFEPLFKEHLYFVGGGDELIYKMLWRDFSAIGLLTYNTEKEKIYAEFYPYKFVDFYQKFIQKAYGDEWDRVFYFRGDESDNPLYYKLADIPLMQNIIYDNETFEEGFLYDENGDEVEPLSFDDLAIILLPEINESFYQTLRRKYSVDDLFQRFLTVSKFDALTLKEFEETYTEVFDEHYSYEDLSYGRAYQWLDSFL